MLQLLSAAGAAAALHGSRLGGPGTDLMPRTSVVRRSMFDVASKCDSHRAVADNVCADVRLSHYADRFLRARSADFDRASRSITRRIDWLRLGS